MDGTVAQGSLAGMKAPESVVVSPVSRFELSPYLFMQFMEPLGAADSSVDAAWDYERMRWREDFIEASKELSPGLLRWGGCFSSYYRWKEAVGPRRGRKAMTNLLWGGVFSNQVGTHEVIDFCRQVSADPLLQVNFESDGRRHWARPEDGTVRSAGAAEAAEWVDYCNNPGNRMRKRNGAPKPFGVKLWQVGNETSYDKSGFDCETAARKTLSFAKRMRKADPSIKLIGWGDSGWAPRMLEVAGSELDYIAFHHHFKGAPDSPLTPFEFRKDPDATWLHLMRACKSAEEKIQSMREQVSGHGVGLAMTECHFNLKGRNRCEVLSSWAAGVVAARLLNVHARNGDILKIATLADFCGTRWMVNAIMMPVPRYCGKAYLMPVARAMSLFRRHSGRKALDVVSSPDSLDVTASVSGSRVFLHVVNHDMRRTVSAKFSIPGKELVSGKVFEICEKPFREIDETCADAFAPKEKILTLDGWDFPPASVSAVELTLKSGAAKGPKA